MKIEINKKDAENLLMALTIAEWVTAEDTDEQPEICIDFKELFSKLAAMIKKEYAFEWLVPDKKTGEIYLNDDRNEFIYEEIFEPHNDKEFWDALAEKFAWKDMRDKYGEQKLKLMDQEKRFVEFCSIEEKYNKELSKNGFRNVQIMK